MSGLDTVGRIFDIQRYSLHDGDGVRSIVFLKGCVFRCRWCCNPESQSYKTETMLVAGKPKTIGRDVTVREVMEEITRDRIYYRRSGGGLTLSGGESLCQPDFTAELLKAACNEGLTTAMESMAYADWTVIEKILPYLDCYLCDIKHINAQKHKEWTTKSNELPLENIKKIVAGGTRLIARTPVIPGFNDTESEIGEIADFAVRTGIKELHLLPYHRMGRDKYDGLSREYTMGDVQPPDTEKLQRLLQAAQSRGLECRIGG